MCTFVLKIATKNRALDPPPPKKNTKVNPQVFKQHLFEFDIVIYNTRLVHVCCMRGSKVGEGGVKHIPLNFMGNLIPLLILHIIYLK